jgi:hypothetical protein
VRIWRIGFLITAGRRGRTSGKCETRYDVAASESQIEFGEAMIMETNELIRRPMRKLCAQNQAGRFRLFRAQKPNRRSVRPWIASLRSQ